MSRNQSLLVLIVVMMLSSIMLTRSFQNKPSSNAQTTQKRVGTDSINMNVKQQNPKKTIEISVSMPINEFVKLQQLNHNYEAAHTDRIYILTNLPEDAALGEYSRLSRLGEAPDIMMLDNTVVNQFASLGYIKPLNDFFTNDAQSKELSVILDQLKWNGYIWGFPAETDPYITVYNKSILNDKNANLQPNTMEAMIALNKAFAKPNEGSYGIYVNPEDPYAFISLFWSLGGNWNMTDKTSNALESSVLSNLLDSIFSNAVELQKKDGSKVAAKTDNSKIGAAKTDSAKTDAAKTDAAKTDASKAPKALYPAEINNPWALLEQGKLGMMITTFTDYRLHFSSGLQMIPLPSNGEGTIFKKSWLKGKSFTISSKTDHMEEAYEWIQEMTSKNNQLALMDAGGALPVFNAPYDTALFPGDSRYNKEIENSLNEGRVFPAEPALPAKIKTLQLELSSVWRGVITWKEFADHINKQWLELSAISTP